MEEGEREELKPCSSQPVTFFTFHPEANPEMSSRHSVVKLGPSKYFPYRFNNYLTSGHISPNKICLLLLKLV